MEGESFVLEIQARGGVFCFWRSSGRCEQGYERCPFIADVSVSTSGVISVQAPALFVVENLLVITVSNTHVHTTLFFNRPFSLVGFVYPIQIMYDS